MLCTRRDTASTLDEYIQSSKITLFNKINDLPFQKHECTLKNEEFLIFGIHFHVNEAMILFLLSTLFNIKPFNFVDEGVEH